MAAIPLSVPEAAASTDTIQFKLVVHSDVDVMPSSSFSLFCSVRTRVCVCVLKRRFIFLFFTSGTGTDRSCVSVVSANQLVA